MSRRPAPDLRVHISRVVIDQAAVSHTGAAGPRERLADRIAARIADPSTAVPGGPASPFSIADAIADAVAARVSPAAAAAGAPIRPEERR